MGVAEVHAGPGIGLCTGWGQSHRLYAERIECGVNKTRMDWKAFAWKVRRPPKDLRKAGFRQECNKHLVSTHWVLDTSVAKIRDVFAWPWRVKF